MHYWILTLSLLKLLATFVADSLELRTYLLHLQRLETLDLFLLLKQLLFLACLFLLTRFLASCILSTDDIWDVTGVSRDVSRATAR